MNPVLAAVLAAVVVALATPLAARGARRLGIVDRPGPLKPQEATVPYLGGLAVLLGLAGPTAMTRPLLLVPLVMAAALGVADDAVDVPPRIRLVAELAVGVLVAAAVPTRLDTIGFVVVAFATVATINAVNLVDGLDGLAAVVTGLASAVLVVTTAGDDRALPAATVGACVGFLVHNRPPASIYLGDAGSYLLGTCLAAGVASSWAEDRPVASSIAALVAVVPGAVELAMTVLRRLRARRPLFEGDRHHLYDRLRRRGWSAGAIDTAYCVALAALSGAAIASRSSTEAAASVLAAGVAGLVLIDALVGTGEPGDVSRARRRGAGWPRSSRSSR
jgi:UDP-N-acetylmuramyl pentapeptide phosphotransferase/UDP-N-acetylglucosamine-1-phosphate transferase